MNYFAFFGPCEGPTLDDYLIPIGLIVAYVLIIRHAIRKANLSSGKMRIFKLTVTAVLGLGAAIIIGFMTFFGLTCGL